MGVAVTVIVFTAGCTPQAPTRSDVVRPVKTTVVTAGGEPHMRVFPGKVEAVEEGRAAFQVPGLLVKLPVREGQKVAKGEMIAQLRQDEFQARLKTLQGQLDQARAALTALRAGERPEERLRREAQVRAAEARLANARTEFDRNALLSDPGPFRGGIRPRRNRLPRRPGGPQGRPSRCSKRERSPARKTSSRKEAEVRGLEGRVVEANIQLQDSTLRAPTTA